MRRSAHLVLLLSLVLLRVRSRLRRPARFFPGRPLRRHPAAQLPAARRLGEAARPERRRDARPTRNKIVRVETGDPDAVSADPVVQTSRRPRRPWRRRSASFDGHLQLPTTSPPSASASRRPTPTATSAPTTTCRSVNLMFRVFDKAGTPLTAPLKVSSIFAPARRALRRRATTATRSSSTTRWPTAG